MSAGSCTPREIKIGKIGKGREIARQIGIEIGITRISIGRTEEIVERMSLNLLTVVGISIKQVIVVGISIKQVRIVGISIKVQKAVGISIEVQKGRMITVVGSSIGLKEVIRRENMMVSKT